MSVTRRERAPACIDPETYRYFLDPRSIDSVWARCADAFGPWQEHSSLPIRELRAYSFVLRAPDIGTPMTVLRGPNCRPEDLRRLHEILAWHEDHETEATA